MQFASVFRLYLRLFLLFAMFVSGKLGSWQVWRRLLMSSNRNDRDSQMRCMSKIVEGIFVPRLDSPNEPLWNGRLWRRVQQVGATGHMLRHERSS